MLIKVKERVDLVKREMVTVVNKTKRKVVRLFEKKPVRQHEQVLVLEDDCIVGETPTGYKVLLSDEALQLYGVTWYNPMAVTFKFLVEGEYRYAIAVNRSFLARPDWFKSAVYAHEDGHIVLDHLNQVDRSMMFDVRKEIEADRYAADRGYKMLDVLEWYEEHYGWIGDERLMALKQKEIIC